MLLQCPSCGVGVDAPEHEGVCCAVCDKPLMSANCFGPVAAPILQYWVQCLGLRHQGVLMASVRGCDTAPRDDDSKLFARCVREAILRPHCGNSAGAATFIQRVLRSELQRRFTGFIRDADHYPHHYMMHIIHAIEIIGYHHPDGNVRQTWKEFYEFACRRLHLNPETPEQLSGRLDADEATFKAMA